MKKILFISMFSCFLTCTEVQASIANSTSSSSQFNQISTNLSNEEFGKHILKKFIQALCIIKNINLGKMRFFALIMT